MTLRTRIAAFIVGACAVAALAVNDGFAAGSVTAGRQKALACQACHGMDGKAKIPEAPNLAGQSDIYLVKALKDLPQWRAQERHDVASRAHAQRQGCRGSCRLLLGDRGHGLVAAEIVWHSRHR